MTHGLNTDKVMDPIIVYANDEPTTTFVIEPIFMYKYKNNMLPQSFDGSFVTNKDTHYHTINKENLKSCIGKIKTIFNNGPKIWNALQNELKHAKFLSLFRSKIKSHIASSYMIIFNVFFTKKR